MQTGFRDSRACANRRSEVRRRSDLFFDNNAWRHDRAFLWTPALGIAVDLSRAGMHFGSTLTRRGATLQVGEPASSVRTLIAEGLEPRPIVRPAQALAAALEACDARA